MASPGRAPIGKTLRAISYRLAFLSIICLAAGALLVHGGWAGSRDRAAIIAAGVEADARITSVREIKERFGRNSYALSLLWTDKGGQTRTTEVTHISLDFWKQIAPDGTLAAQQTRIRYLEDQPTVSPIILADQADHERSLQNAKQSGPTMLIVGGVLAWLTWRRAAAAAREP